MLSGLEEHATSCWVRLRSGATGSDKAKADEALARVAMARSPVYLCVQCFEDGDGRCGPRARNCGVRHGALALVLAGRGQPGDLSAVPSPSAYRQANSFTTTTFTTITLPTRCLMRTYHSATMQHTQACAMRCH